MQGFSDVDVLFFHIKLQINKIIYCYYTFLFVFESSNTSDVTSSVISFLSVTTFFFTTTSSLTYGFFVTCASSLFNGIFISSDDCIGFCSSPSDSSLGGLFSILSISSLFNSTSTVFVSFTGFLVITFSSTTTLLLTSNSSDFN